jgi:hypothetical protein
MDIGLRWIRVTLRGYGGEPPTGHSFFSRLGTEHPAELTLSPSARHWQAARVEMFTVDMHELQGLAEPYEEFSARVRQGFLRAATWLNSCEPSGIEQWREEGRKADIFVGGWLANEQLDLEFPAEFLVACGRLGLSIQTCTND